MGLKQNPWPRGPGCQLRAVPCTRQGERRRRRAGESNTNESFADVHRYTRTDINHQTTTTTTNPSALTAFLMPLQPSVSPGGRLSFSILKGFVNSLQTRKAKAAELRARPAAGFDGPSGRALRSCLQPAVPCLQQGRKRTRKTHAPIIDYLITHAGSHRGGGAPAAAARWGAFLALLGHFLFPQVPSLTPQQALKGPWSLPCLTPCLSFPPDEMKWMLAIFLPTVMETRHVHGEPEQRAGFVSCPVLAFQPGRSGKKKKKKERGIYFLSSSRLTRTLLNLGQACLKSLCSEDNL